MIRPWSVAVVLVAAASSVAAAHPDCCDGGVVGRHDCRRFGDGWGAWHPNVVTELGVTMRRTTFPAATPGSLFRATGGVDLATERQVDTLGTEMRLGVELPSGVTILGHLDAGFATTDALLSTGLAVGWRTTHGRVVFGGELLGGARWFMMGGTYDEGTEEMEFADTQAALLLDARVRADVWIAPWLSANLWVGSSIVERGDVSGGVSFSISTRPFRGR